MYVTSVALAPISLHLRLKPREVPYGREGDGPSQGAFVDLRARPEAIDQLPETGLQSPLREPLELINGRRSPFWSFASGLWLGPPDASGSAPTAYIGFAFTDAKAFAEPEPLYGLFQQLAPALPLASEARARCVLLPIDRRAKKQYGWGLELWAWSDDPDRAAASYAAGQVFVEFTSFLRARLER
jgi:hypothetical protein